MRTFGGDARRSRSLARLFDEALSLLRQDIADYGFAGLLGAIAAAATALVLSLNDGLVERSLVLPAVFLVSLLTYAHAAAAVRRVRENLEPGSVAALIAIMVRAPWIIGPALPPMIISFGAVLAAQLAQDAVGAEVATTAAMAVVASTTLLAFPLALRVPALLVVKATPGKAAAHAAAATGAKGGAVAISFSIALAPAGLLALYALTSEFHVIAMALAAFAWTATMPLLAAMATLIWDATAPASDGPRYVRAQRVGARRPTPVQDRLSRHVR